MGTKQRKSKGKNEHIWYRIVQFKYSITHQTTMLSHSVCGLSVLTKVIARTPRSCEFVKSITNSIVYITCQYWSTISNHQVHIKSRSHILIPALSAQDGLSITWTSVLHFGNNQPTTHTDQYSWCTSCQHYLTSYWHYSCMQPSWQAHTNLLPDAVMWYLWKSMNGCAMVNTCGHCSQQVMSHHVMHRHPHFLTDGGVQQCSAHIM